MLAMEPAWFDELRTGEAASRTSPSAVLDVVGGLLPNLVADAVKLVVFLGFLCSISGVLTLLSIPLRARPAGNRQGSARKRSR